jgi:SET domain-containing protein
VTRTREACYRIGRSATGLGLFATAPIERGAFIVEYSGKRIPTRDAKARERTSGARYMFEINSRWTVDGSPRSNIGRYANHSCRPNAESAIWKGKVILRAISPIMSGEEITYDYGAEYFELFIRPNGCQCAKCVEAVAKRKSRKRRANASARPARPPGHDRRHSRAAANST